MALCAVPDDQIDILLSDSGLRLTKAVRSLLAYLVGHADASFTRAQLQLTVQGIQRFYCRPGSK